MSHLQQSFIKRVTHHAKEALEIPMWGNPPEFPLSIFCQKLREKLQIKELKASITSSEWRHYEDLLEGMGDNPLLTSFTLSPLGESIFWIMPFEDLLTFNGWALSEGEENFADPELSKGYYRFLVTHAIDALMESQGIGDLSLKLSEDSLPREDSYCIDISLRCEETTVWGRVIFPPTFQERFKEYFAIGKGPFSAPLSPHVNLPISLDVGQVLLTYEEIDRVQQGDFIILDQCSYHLTEGKGVCTLSLDSNPLFQVKLKDEKIKILDFANYYEELKMDEDMNENHEENLPPEFSGEGEPHPPSEEIEARDEESTEERFVEEPSIEPTPEIASPKDVPLKLAVQVARVKMSLEKLLQLKPGNVLELGVKPEQGVNLTLEGKVIARGQLLQVGEVLGVKITDITS